MLFHRPIKKRLLSKFSQERLIACSAIAATVLSFSSTALAGPDMNDPEVLLDLLGDSIPTSCSYTMDIRFEGAEEAILRTLRYEPNTIPNWTLLALNGVTATEEERSSFKAPPGLHPEGTGPISTLMTAAFDPIEQTDEFAIYRTERLPSNATVVSNSDISRHMRAELKIDKAEDAKHSLITTISNKKSFRFKLFARVMQAIEIRRFTQLDAEWLVPDEIELTYTARVFGRTITEQETRKYTNVVCE